MNRKYLLTIAGIVTLGIVGFGIYQWWLNHQLSPAWSAVPVNSILVAEVDNPLEITSQWKEDDTWQPIVALPYFQTLLSRFSALQQYPESRDILDKKKILLSLHVTTRNDFDYVFYIPLTNKEKNAAQKLIQQFRNDPEFRADTRTFGDHLITEITHRSSRQLFSFILTDDVLIGSYTSFLVEDVIRKLNEGTVSRNTRWNNWQSQHSISRAPVQLYINLPASPRLVQMLTGNSKEAGLLPSLGQFSNLELTREENKITLKGKTYLNDESIASSYLSLFEGQEAQPVSCLSLIPNQTAVLYHWTFSKPQAFFKQHYQYDSLYHGYSHPKYFSWIGQEMALALIETVNNQPDYLLCIQTNNTTDASRELNNVVIQFDSEQDTPSYTEKYKGVLIHQINKSEFPSTVFGAELIGFPQCFYTIIGKYVVFGSSIQTIKNLIDNRTTGEVWSQSTHKRNLFQQEKPAHLTIHTDISHAWGMLFQHAAPHWKQLMQQYSNELKDFEEITVQLHKESDHSATTQIVAYYREKPVKASIANNLFISWKASADTLLTMSPVLVRSHIDRSREVLLQDAAHRMYLVSQSGKVLWRKWLESSVQGEVFQIDYLKNDKLQYLFTTHNQLSLLDRNGSPVAPFPITVPAATNLHTLSLVDYDSNLEYRFLVSDLLGNLYMYDKKGSLLEGWDPLHTGYRLECAPKHIRIHEKDYFIVLQANGKLSILNRRGQVYSGFPIDLKARTESGFLIENGLSPESTKIVIVTQGGEIIHINLLGEVQRKQLYHTSGNNLFRLCIEPQQKDWVIARVDNRFITILDKNGEQIWETTTDGGPISHIQYYNFGAGLRLVALTNQNKKQTSIYDLSGHLVGNAPINSSTSIAAVYVDAYDKLLVYHINTNQIEVLSAKIK